MLMSAGLGTRLRPFTQILPKPFLPVLGVPLAQFALDSLAEAGVQRVVVNVHHFAEKARKQWAEMELHGMELLISDEASALLGSGGGIRRALEFLGNEPFFLMNADVLSGLSLKELAFAHQRHRSCYGAQLTLAVLASHSGKGSYRELFLNEEGQVVGLGSVVAQRPFYVGAAVIEPAALKSAPDGGSFEFVPEILQPAIANRSVGYYLIRSPKEELWFDIGDPKLWLDTHLRLIEKLELGQLPKSWRKRIEKLNHRTSSLIWVSNSAPWKLNLVEWEAPCYWSNQCTHDLPPPGNLGPSAVLYGQVSSPGVFKNGIGMDGCWVQL